MSQCKVVNEKLLTRIFEVMEQFARLHKIIKLTYVRVVVRDQKRHRCIKASFVEKLLGGKDFEEVIDVPVICELEIYVDCEGGEKTIGVSVGNMDGDVFATVKQAEYTAWDLGLIGEMNSNLKVVERYRGEKFEDRPDFCR